MITEAKVKEIIRSLNDKYQGDFDDEIYVHDSNCYEVVNSIKGVNYIDTYASGNNNGFFLKIGDYVLTIYCHCGENRNTYKTQLSITRKSGRRISQVGGGYGTSGTDFVHEAYELRMNEFDLYENKNVKALYQQVVEAFKKCYTE